MKICFVDGTELQIGRLQMNFGNSFNGAVFDSFMVAKEEIERLGVDAIMNAIREDNISLVKYVREDGNSIERQYRYIHEKRYVFGDTVDVLTVSLSQNPIGGGGIVGEE